MGKKTNLEDVFYPRNVAVVGASENPVKLGFHALTATVSGGLKGKVFPVSPSLAGREIMGVVGYGSIEELPEDAQLMVFAIPHNRIVEALKSAAKKGAKGVVIFAGGFREVGDEGVRLQREVKETADSLGIKIIGPNCVGTVNIHHGLNATFAHPLSMLKKGGVSVVSQSGGTGSAIVTTMADNNVGLSKFISIGNRVNLDFAEIVEYLADDDDTNVICLFIEGMDDGRAFFESARAAAEKKPILAYQAGFTETTRRLSLSHTGSMSASRDIYRAAYRQAGVLFVNDYEELVDTAKALSAFSDLPVPKLNSGERPGVAIFTHTAGPALIVAETVENAGASLPDFTQKSKEEIVEFAPEFTVPTNPLDMFAHAWFMTDMYLKAADLALSQPNIHIACSCYSGGSEVGMAFPAGKYAEIAKSHNKPAVVCLMAPYAHFEERAAADEAGAPTFNSPHKAGRTIANMIRWWKMKNRV
jgi:acetyltransferase